MAVVGAGDLGIPPKGEVDAWDLPAGDEVGSRRQLEGISGHKLESIRIVTKDAGKRALLQLRPLSVREYTRPLVPESISIPETFELVSDDAG